MDNRTAITAIIIIYNHKSSSYGRRNAVGIFGFRSTGMRHTTRTPIPVHDSARIIMVYPLYPVSTVRFRSDGAHGPGGQGGGDDDDDHG